MKKYSLLRIIYLVVCATLFFGCSAEDGTDGAIGPQGEQGDIGAQGEQGPQGEEGNSNVISSGWFGINPWSFDEPFLKANTIYELTDSQLENASILVYRKRSNIVVEALPIVVYTLNGEIFRVTRINIFNNELRIVIEGRDVEIQSGEYLPPEVEFRYIISVPPSTADKSSRVDFSKMSYEEVVDYLGLEP